MKQFILSILIITSMNLYAQCQGDLNNDGLKNVVDVVALVNDVLNGNTTCDDNECSDSDADGICDDVDDCDGIVDDCGVCNGNGVNSCGLCSEYVELFDYCYHIPTTTYFNFGWAVNGTSPSDNFPILTADELNDFFATQITRLVNLTELDISNFDMSYPPYFEPKLEVPNNLTDLVNLEIFTFTENSISSFPDVLTEMTHLKVISLMGNPILTIPDNIDNLVNLEELDLRVCDLVVIPENICNLPEDVILNLSYNNLCEEYHFECLSEFDYFWSPQEQSNCP